MTKHITEQATLDNGGVRVAVGTVLWDQRNFPMVTLREKIAVKKGEGR
jgi:hypothetical protein